MNSQTQRTFCTDSGTSIQLRLGDSIEQLRTLEDQSVDLVICDLPYGTTACAWDSVIDLDQLWEQYNRITPEHAPVILTGVQPFTTAVISSNIKNFRYSMVYQKTYATNWMNARRRPMPDHEDIMVFYRRQPTYNPQMVYAGKPTAGHYGGSELYNSRTEMKSSARAGSTDRFPRTVLGPYSHAKRDIPAVLNIRCHPTQKPTGLLRWLIRTYSNPGDVVLDNTCGSGSTGVACVAENRSFTGIEQDPGYFDSAVRWIEYELENLQ